MSTDSQPQPAATKGKAAFLPIDGHHCTAEFVGADLTVERYEEIAVKMIKPKLLALEPALNKTKWFDYRLLHPTQATYLFAHYYTVATQRVMKKYRDMTRGEYVRGFRGEDLFRDLPVNLTVAQAAARKGQMTGFWKARQYADSLGVPYLLCIGDTLTHAMDMGWPQFPRPSQLGCKPYLVDHLKATWQMRCESQVQVADSDFFHAQRYRKQADQLDHMKWLIASVNKATNKPWALAGLIDTVIPEKIATPFFGSEIVQEAKRLSHPLPA